MWDTIKDILSQALRQWRPIGLIYFVQLFLGLFVAVSAYRQLNGAIGKSLELDRLAKGFDRSILSDMVNEFPKVISSIQGSFLFAVIAFLIISIFLHAGLLGNIKRREYTISTFLSNGKRYFTSFLAIAIIAIIKMIVTLAIIWIPFVKLIGDPLETFHSEKPFIQTVVALIIFSVMLVSVIWLWSVLTRYQKIEGKKLVQSMKDGWTQLRLRFFRYFLIAMLFIFIQVIVTWLYTYVVDDWGAESWLCVFSLLFIQQLFSVIRVFIRTSAYSALDS